MFFTTLLALCQTAEFMFWGSAIFGTVLFCFRLILSFAGGFLEELGESNHTFDDGNEVHHNSTGSFRLFTVHSISGFFMMFGWVGLAYLKQLHYTSEGSLLVALGAGITIMVITALIFRGAQMLINPGVQFDSTQTVGLTGTVYQQISSQAPGKIHVVVDGVTRELLAQSLNHTFIPSFKLVTIVKVLDHEMVIVEEINS